jgi:hypothetical protein
MATLAVVSLLVFVVAAIVSGRALASGKFHGWRRAAFAALFWMAPMLGLGIPFLGLGIFFAPAFPSPQAIKEWLVILMMISPMYLTWTFITALVDRAGQQRAGSMG